MWTKIKGFFSSLWSGVKTFFEKFWFIVAAIGSGVLAIIFLGRDSRYRPDNETLDEIKKIEEKKKKKIEEINKREEEIKTGEERIDSINKEHKEKIEGALSNDKDIEDVVSDFTDSWNGSK